MHLIAVEIRSSRMNFPTSTPKIPQTPNGPGVDGTRECMFSEYDFQFHTKIIDYLENIQFSNVFAMFMYRMKRLAELSLAHKGRMEQTYEEHMAILDCMKNGDTSRIYEITLKHMETPRDINLEDL